MKIISFRDGLGNQLFQYRLCQYLKEKYPHEKIYGYYNNKLLKAHNGLEIFNHFDVEKPKSTLMTDTIVFILKIIDKVIPVISRDCRWKENAILYIGYWQDQKIWGEHKAIPFKTLKLSQENQQCLSSILQSNSVSIHIRRGDYLLPQNTIYNVCDIDYYKRAIKYMKSVMENPVFFVFSDDISWVRENLDDTNMFYVDYNTGRNSFIDMFLMSNCKSSIIANSSFSYWGAINGLEKKHVIYPLNWKIKTTLERPDIFKKTWIGL